MNKQQLNDEIKSAMKSGDTVRRDTLRLVLNEVKNEEISSKQEATDEVINSMIKRVLKQTSETLENSIKAGNNQERTERLQEQVNVLKSCLPKMLSGDELNQMIDKIISENHLSSMKDMGTVMKLLKETTGGAFDGKEASTNVKSRLS